MPGHPGRTRRRLASGVTVVLLLMSMATVAAAQHDGGHEGKQGLACSALVPGSKSLAISPGSRIGPVVGDDGTIRAVLDLVETEQGITFDWSASMPVDAVIVAGGPKVMVWEYEPPASAGSGLHAPLTNDGGHYHMPRTVSVCYRVDPPEVDLEVTKVDTSDPVRVGDEFDYLITISNSGESSFTEVALEDALPAEVDPVGVSGCPDWDGSRTISCVFGEMTAGSSASVTVTVTAVTPGVAVNHARVTATGPGGEVSASASEATVIEKTHDDDHGHEEAKPVCDQVDPALEEISARKGLHSGTVTLSDDRVSVTMSISDVKMGTVFDWSSTYPLSAVITAGGPATLTYEYEPPAFSGEGLHAPLSGGGSHYRGLHQVAFCYLPGPFVDVAVGLAAKSGSVAVDELVGYTATVTNLGVVAAQDVELVFELPPELEESDSSRVAVGAVDPGQEMVVEFEARGVTATAAATLTATVTASNEDDDVLDNNRAEAIVEVLAANVPVPVTLGPPTSTTTTTTAPSAPEVLGETVTTTVPSAQQADTLPFTGGDLGALAAMGLVAMIAGTAILTSRRPLREVDVIVYRQGEKPTIPW